MSGLLYISGKEGYVDVRVVISRCLARGKGANTKRKRQWQNPDMKIWSLILSQFVIIDMCLNLLFLYQRPASTGSYTPKSSIYTVVKAQHSKHSFLKASTEKEEEKNSTHLAIFCQHLKSTIHSKCLLRQRSKIKLALPFRHILSRSDTMHLHIRVILQIRQKLGRDEEILWRVFWASDIHHAWMHHTFVARVHSLVDLVDDAEGCAG